MKLGGEGASVDHILIPALGVAYLIYFWGIAEEGRWHLKHRGMRERLQTVVPQQS